MPSLGWQELVIVLILFVPMIAVAGLVGVLVSRRGSNQPSQAPNQFAPYLGFCTRCGAANDPPGPFCAGCGAPLTRP